MKTKIMSLLGLMVMGITAAYGSQTDQPKMNGKLIIRTLAPEEIRYTGKPYSKALSAYVFNARNYDPQVARWTTPDPSGFPDGANNYKYGSAPNFEIDIQGLWTLRLKSTQSSYQTSGTSDFKAEGADRTMNVLGRISTNLSPSDENYTGATITGFSRAMYLHPPTGAAYKNITASLNISVDSKTGKITITDGGGQYIGADNNLSIAMQLNGFVSADGNSATANVYSDGVYSPSGVNGANFNIGVGPITVGVGLSWTGGRGQALIHTSTLEFEAVE